MLRIVKIFDVCEFQSGLWKGKEGPFTSAYVIRNTNFRPEGNLSYENVALLEVKTKELSKRQLQHGDIILEKSGGGEKTPVGRVCLFEKQDNKIAFSLSNFTCFIRVKEPSILDYKYLHKFLYFMYVSGKTEPMQRNSTGIRNLQLKEYKDISIVLPPIVEQQRIVAKLDAVFAGIDKTITVAQTSAEEAEMLFQKYLSKVFKGGDDWVDKSINDMTDKTKNVNPNKSPDAQFKYVDVSSVSNKKFEITETQLLFGKDAPSRAKKNIITNDIIFATVRPTLKRVAIIPKELNNQVASTGYVILRTNKSNHYKFLFYFLLSNIFMKAMKSLQRGASYPAVTDMDVKSQRLKVPNYQEQIKISKKLDNIMQLTNNIRKIQNKKIKELNLLKKSILRKILNTKLIKVA